MVRQRHRNDAVGLSVIYWCFVVEHPFNANNSPLQFLLNKYVINNQVTPLVASDDVVCTPRASGRLVDNVRTDEAVLEEGLIARFHERFDIGPCNTRTAIHIAHH